MKLNKSKLPTVLLALFSMAYLGVMAYLALQANDSDTVYAILFGGIIGPVVGCVLVGIFLDLFE